MNTRQATKRMAILFALLSALSACSPKHQPTLPSLQTTPTRSIAPTVTQTPIPSTKTSTPTQTPLACLTQPGHVEQNILESTKPHQEFFIYLPPCYAEQADTRYPVLYLLHGQTYRADQWIRLGAVDMVDNLIRSGESMPFIIVFPDDRYWNQPSGAGFGERLTNELIPYIDKTYRTISDPRFRAIGGLSRGAGWALQLGLTRPDLFSIIGLHSLAVFQKDASKIPNWLADLSSVSQPRIFMDIGEDDQELASATQIETIFTQFDLPHEWRLYSGDHTEEYWSAHMEEYIQWYAEQWNELPK
jgi:enterochelin esterase-like enzyme